MAKLNKYERKVMHSIYVIITAAVILSLVALIASFLTKKRFTMFLVLQLVHMSVFYIRGAVSSLGEQNIPIASALFIRIMQLLLNVVWLSETTVPIVVVLILLDLVFSVLLYLDRLHYTYEYIVEGE